MKLFNLLTALKCKVFICCKSKCSLNDNDGDGVIDSITVQKENYDKEIKIFTSNV